MFNKTWLLDTVERVVATAVEVALGVLVVNVGDIEHQWRGVVVAGVAAGAAALKAAIASRIGGQGAGVLVDAEPKA